jgi:hypothetical protein
MANTSRVSYETNYRRFGIWKVRKRVAFNVINRSAQTRTAITNHLNAIFDTQEGTSLLAAIARRGQRRVNIFLQSADNVWAMVYHGDIFLTPGYQVSINVAGSGIRQTESTRRILAHELGHVAFPGRTEQQIVNTVENPIAQRFGWNLRGQY